MAVSIGFVMALILGQCIAEAMAKSKPGDLGVWVRAWLIQWAIYFVAFWFADPGTFGQVWGWSASAVFLVRWGLFMYRLPKDGK